MESLPFIHLLGSRLSFLTTVTLTLRSPIRSASGTSDGVKHERRNESKRREADG